MTTGERLGVAALVSVGLHALLIVGGRLPLPGPPGERQPLEARLAPAPQPLEEPPVVQPAPRHEPSQPRRPAPPAAAAAPAVMAQAPSAAPREPGLEMPAESAEATAPDERSDPRQPLQPAGPATTPSADQPSAAGPAAEAAPPRSLPRKGTITYTLNLGNDGFSVGKAVQSWEVGRGTYKLASDAETTGIVALFRPQRLIWMSKGRITRQGLKPESFLVSRTWRGQTEAAEAQFDWNAGSVTYGPARERASAALPGNTQDIMSFIFQLGLAPPAPGRFRLPITTGTKFDIYEIEVLAEETIETPLGTMRSLPVRQQHRPGTESIEIWLAAEYRYLPVKIRYFDRNGNPAGEQVASDIRVSDD